jgi:hypothetical protein
MCPDTRRLQHGPSRRAARRRRADPRRRRATRVARSRSRMLHPEAPRLLSALPAVAAAINGSAGEADDLFHRRRRLHTSCTRNATAIGSPCGGSGRAIGVDAQGVARARADHRGVARSSDHARPVAAGFCGCCSHVSRSKIRSHARSALGAGLGKSFEENAPRNELWLTLVNHDALPEERFAERRRREDQAHEAAQPGADPDRPRLEIEQFGGGATKIALQRRSSCRAAIRDAPVASTI